jgi:hypothetical protein
MFIYTEHKFNLKYYFEISNIEIHYFSQKGINSLPVALED